jgi:hypothetical protein
MSIRESKKLFLRKCLYSFLDVKNQYLIELEKEATDALLL